MRWHWQNLNEGGSGLRYGRAWFYLTKHLTFNPEWTFGRNAHTGIGIKFGGDERTIMLSLGIAYLFQVYVSFNGAWPRRWGFGKYGEQERDFSLRWSDGDIHLHFASDWTEPSYHGVHRNIWTQPGSRSWLITPKDILLGRPKYEEREIETVPVKIPMPEKVYDGTVKIFESTWTRPRWPWFPKRMRRTTVDVPTGIPFPGKGENSWDCGDDATFGLTSPATTPAAAVGAIVESVLRNRERYGGRAWTPKTADNGELN